MKILSRLALLSLAAALVPACGHTHDEPGVPGGAGGGGGGGGGGGAITLLSENFSGGFPGANWTAPVVTGDGSVAADAGAGSPAPSLALTSADRPGTGTTESQSSFAMGPVTVSAVISASSNNQGDATIALVQTAGGATIASAAFDAFTEEIAFLLDGNSQTASVPADGAFHTVRLSVDGAGNAEWTLDGGAAVIQSAAFPPAAARLALSVNIPNAGGPTIPAFRIDNVVVTSP